MHRQLVISIVLVITFLSKGVLAQVSASSTNPPDIKWQKIEAEKVTVLFPKGLEQEAARIAATTSFIDKNRKESIGDKNYDLTILLHGRSMFPNGFVTTSPFRSEFFGTPIQDWSIMGPINWLDLLAVHEYRHALQFSNADRGVTKVFHILSGQLGWNVAANLSIPDWFWEGDATLSETLQTPAGRGRNPSFSEEQRALFAANKHYRYQVVRNGSFVKRLPSHYPLGYTLNLYARSEYGNDIWSSVIKDAGAYRRPIYPFNGALKRHTGLNSKKLYKASYRAYEAEVDSILSNRTLTDFNYEVEPEKKLVSFYEFPHTINDGSILVQKSSYRETPALVEINENGEENKLVNIGITSNSFISKGTNKVLWLENEANPRWANEDFTRVITYDLNTNLKTVNFSKTKAVFAAIAEDDDYVALVSLSPLQIYSLELKSATDANKNKKLNNEDNWAIAYPNFDDGVLYYLAKRNSEVAIVAHDIESDSKQLLTPWLIHALSDLYVGKQALYFRADFDGFDNIFSISKQGGDITTITSAKVGASSPAVSSDGKLFYANATHTGRYLASMSLSDAINKTIEIEPLTSMEVFKSVNSLSESEDILHQVPETAINAQAYKGAFKGWRLHSWGLEQLSEGGNFISGFKANVEVDDFLEQNRLVPFVGYNFNENNVFGGADYSFGKYFTLLNVGYSYRERQVTGAKSRVLNFQEQEARLGLSVPLNWIQGNYRWSASIASNVAMVDFIKGSEEQGFRNPNTTFYNLQWRLGSKRQRAFQNLQSRFGFDFTGTLAQSISGAGGNLFRTAFALQLPGVAKNHGLELTAAIQKELFTNEYQFQDTFSYPRGFAIGDNNGVQKISADYELPLLYPDFGFAGLIYFKRVRANLFYDLGQFEGNNIMIGTQSGGVELRFDNSYLNQYNIPIGLRLGYRTRDPFDLGGIFINLLIGG